MWNKPFKKISRSGTKIRPVKNNKSDSNEIWGYYAEGLNHRRVIFEFIVPIIMALFSLIITLLSNSSITEMLLKIKETHIILFAIITIQIGFNITSLVFISSFNKEALQNLFSKVKDTKIKEKVLKQLLASFVYCVLIQTSIIIFGFLYNINVDNLIAIQQIKQINFSIKNILAFGFYFTWIGVIMHTFIVSIRNVFLIYKFILVSFKN